MAVRVLDLGLDCHRCDDVLKRERGCGKDGILPFEIDGELVFRCPLKLVDSLSWEYVRAYRLYKKDLLPNGVGWLKESAKFIDAMEVMDNEVNKIENEKIEKNNG